MDQNVRDALQYLHRPLTVLQVEKYIVRSVARSSVYFTHHDFGGDTTWRIRWLLLSLSVPSLLPSVPLRSRPPLRLGAWGAPGRQTHFGAFRHKSAPF